MIVGCAMAMAWMALEQIKSIGISNGTLTNVDPTFYNVIDGVLDTNPVPEFSQHVIGQQ